MTKRKESDTIYLQLVQPVVPVRERMTVVNKSKEEKIKDEITVCT
ncbi:MAG: hypothetical protein RR496_06985 [Lachnospiraceae bacterium]